MAYGKSLILRSLKPKRYFPLKDGQHRTLVGGTQYVKTDRGNWMRKNNWIRLQQKILAKARPKGPGYLPDFRHG